MHAHAAYPDTHKAVDPRFASVDCLFFVIGAQKAGTTWLSHYFKTHPNIAVPEWKEHDYWNMVEGRATPSRMLQAQKKRRASFNLMRAVGNLIPFTLYARRQRSITLALRATEAPFAPYSAYADVILENVDGDTGAAGEICPEYAVLNAGTYAQMAALAPNVRFVFLMRDPVSRFISGMRHSMRKSAGKNALTPEEISDNIRALVANPLNRHIGLSRYDKTIAQLEQAVSSESILYLFFEDLFDQDKISEICDFLGVPFVQGNITSVANSAGKADVSVSQDDRAVIAKVLAPAYAFARKRFGSLPAQWEASAELC